MRAVEFPVSSTAEDVPAWRAVARTLPHVFFLTVLFVAMYDLLGRQLPIFADSNGAWLSWSHLLLAVAYFAIHLTNRRYGPDYAFAQIVLSLGLCGTILFIRPDVAQQLLSAQAAPSMREAMAFITSFLASGFLSIIAFDCARGAKWWTAPFIGSIVAGATFSLLFYPAAYSGSDVFWCLHLRIHAGILLIAAVAGLAPYWLLRSSIQPLPGFGGY